MWGYDRMRKVAKTAVASVLVPLYIAGCAFTQRLDKGYPGPVARPPEITQEFHYDKRPLCPIETIIKQNEYYTLRQVTFKAQSRLSTIEHNITIDHYDVQGRGKTPGIFVLPILGGDNIISEIFAHYFAKMGMDSFIVHRQDSYKKLADIESIDAIMRQIVLDHMQAIDYVETLPDIDTTKLGTFGVSMGGIKSALLAGLEDRLAAHVSALSGCDMPYILMHSNEPGVRRRVSALEDKYGLDDAGIQRRLEESIQCDPKNYAIYADAADVLLILGMFDRTVPFETGKRLRKEMGGPKTIYLLSGHYTAVLYIPFVKRKAYEFFKDRFGL